ncbi:hypothetical protein GCM10007905_38000 [Mixta theicola]|nr:hypothetical protein GCM10007905_38000 [Mixta theicola]
MNEVWRKHGMEVTVNTLYQNISILRKTLKRVGIDENIIITVPKKGITLSAQVEALAGKTFISSSSPLTLAQQDDTPLNRKGGLNLFLMLWLLLPVTLLVLWMAFN